ncbi:hypothetical protein L218DRAFT_908363 [Marasmius fiardii PR-910]|nr:hypothetical protein L218DRAFT_908363 [Marasmius fiardii PR-910]
MGGIARRNFNMFRELCGESTLKNVVIATNMWGQVPRDVGEARESELMEQNDFFKPVLDKGAQIVRHDNTPETARAILHHLIQNQPLPLRIQTELVDQKKDIADTAAGAELNREMMEQMKKHQREMRELKEQMEAAIKTKDEETRRELEIETGKLQAEMTRMQNDAQRLSSDYMAQKAELERQLDIARQAAEAEKVEQQRQIEELRRMLEENKKASNAVREHFQQQLNEAKARLNRRCGGFWRRVGRGIAKVGGW